MSEAKGCPKCSGNMEAGYLSNAPYGDEEEVCSLSDGQEESLHTSVGNVASQNSEEIRKAKKGLIEIFNLHANGRQTSRF